ncbi:MAG: OprO/OprP family phosphate-selective porin [Burkholderiales bacterium]
METAVIRKTGHRRECFRAVLFAAVLLGSVSTAAHADATDDLLQFLKDKGVMNEDELQTFKKRFEAERKTLQEQKDNGQALQAAKDPNAMSGSFKNGVTWESADKRTAIGLDGLIQLDYRNFSGPDRANADTFDIRRGQLGIKGRFWDSFEFLVRGDFAGLQGSGATSSHLNQAWLNINFWKQAQLKLGQFKMPINLEERESSRFLDFQEKSFVNNANLTPGRERGAMLWGVPYPGVTYGLALSTGAGPNTNEADTQVDDFDIVGGANVNFAEILGNDKAVYHLGGAFSSGDIADSAAGSQRTEGRGVTFFTPLAFNTGGDGLDRFRCSFETALAHGPVKFVGEYAAVNFDGRSNTGIKIDKDIDAYYLSALWMLTGETYARAYKDGIFGRLAPKSNFNPRQAGAWGAWELGLRYSKFDASDFTIFDSPAPAALAGTGLIQNSATTAFANEADAWTLGLKWIMNPNMRLLLNYVRTDFDTPVRLTSGGKTVIFDDEDTFTLRGQFDF